MGAPRPSDVDPVVLVQQWLEADRDYLESCNLTAEHIGGIMETPWPHVVISDGNGGDPRDLQWDVEHEVRIEVYAHPAGFPGAGETRRIALRTAESLMGLPEDDSIVETDPVVSKVRPSGLALNAPLANGQLCYTTSVFIVVHPPLRAS